MTSPADLVTFGLAQSSGLSLTTGGLLVVEDLDAEGAGIRGRARRVDVQLLFDTDLLDADMAVVLGDLGVDNSLRTALLLSLFTDARASEEELARHGGDNARGWALDTWSLIPGDQYGSKLWLLQRETQRPAVLSTAEDFALQATAWLIEDGIADEIRVRALFPRRGLLALVIGVVRAGKLREQYAFVWEM